MYAQVTELTVPIGQLDSLRDLINSEYFKHVQEREGFVMAHLLEAIDDPERAQIVTYWDSQNAIENARKTGSLKQTVQVLSSYMPQVHMLRQGYIVTINTQLNKASV